MNRFVIVPSERATLTAALPDWTQAAINPQPLPPGDPAPAPLAALTTPLGSWNFGSLR